MAVFGNGMKKLRVCLAPLMGLLLGGFASAGCTEDAEPGMAPVSCESSLSPKAATICTGSWIILKLSNGPPEGTDIAWTSDVGVGQLAYADDKAVFTAPSSGSGTTRIRVRWAGPCDMTSYIGYEPCDGGARLDGAADARASPKRTRTAATTAPRTPRRTRPTPTDYSLAISLPARRNAPTP
jgi:hypothetical protein